MIEIKDIEQRLNKIVGKEITAVQDGFLKSQYSIHKVKYFIEYEILNIMDEDSNNYLKINLNQVYKVENRTNEIIFYLDNDLIISLKINL